MRYSILFLFLSCTILVRPGLAQEIDFKTYHEYTLSLSELSSENLSFGNLVKNEGTVSIPLSEAKVIAVTGLQYLDITVTITADDKLLLDPGCSSDPSCSMDFTLKAAYANLGQNNISHARFMDVSSDQATARFPILGRVNGPPGPPPTPQAEDFNPAAHEGTAYLYIYGDLLVGDVNSGYYTSQISISVSYY